MCGIVGLLLADQSAHASAEICEALGILQHRGQDAAGIITCGEKGRLFQCKGNGMVRDVFSADTLRNLRGYMGVSHVRYPTAGGSSMSEAQPFYVNSPYGISLAHNGNLTNADELREFLDTVAHRHMNTDSDSELLLNMLADNLQRTGKIRIDEDDLFTAIATLHTQVRGGYACVAMLAGFGLIAFRDPNGIRPCVFGKRPSATVPGAFDWMVASESVSLHSLEYRDVHDLGPGEAIIITKTGSFARRSLVSPPRPFTPCIFEYVYFARPDSIMDGVSVYKARLAMGEALAHQVVRKLGPNNDIDVVIPVPDTSRVAAMETALVLNKPFREGLMKNRYIGRTFIMPGQSLRAKSVRRKLNAMPLEFQDKVVLLVDDSIVRGTTSREIVQMARDAGARKVYFASCAPPVRYPNVYGIDMPTVAELVAHGHTEDQVAELIGADEMIYQTLEDLEASVRKFNDKLDRFDTSVFTGCYITGDVTAEYLAELEAARSDAAKEKKVNGPITVNGSSGNGSPSSEQQPGLHNQYHGY
ncbi:phosphoribosyltransferase-like protein [Catenaria anguillulae PL171]|uniref:Amidophosphoribosyltransferase n=1 Tax=Catenaria anguillulae PL171 TaxID=765915 RepID=A0A1Y2HRP6_9FUNG|nr:phosphoribosyltransferase-like protein [Catenaria anguillulae PL171]